MTTINLPDCILTGGLQQLLDDFIRLSHKLPIDIANNNMMPVFYQNVPQDQQADVALAEILAAYRAQQGAEPCTQDVPEFRDKMLDLVHMYPAAMAFATLAKVEPDHPIFAIDSSDQEELRVMWPPQSGRVMPQLFLLASFLHTARG